MMRWEDVPVYLHRQPVDFRKSINGLSVLVEQGMGMSPFKQGLFVFSPRRRDKVKVCPSDRQDSVCGTSGWSRIVFSGPRKWRATW